MERIQLLVEDSIAYITLNRPHIHNPLDLITVQELEIAAQSLSWDPSIRVVVVQGAGKSFSAGADLSYLCSILPDRDKVREFIQQINRAFNSLEQMSVPVIASVQGCALAGGFELMQACDFVIAEKDAVIGDQHAGYGLLPGAGGTQRLPRLVGLQRAKEILFTGRWMNGREAYEIGLVQRIAESGQREELTRDVARQLASRSRNGLIEMKRLLRDGIQLPLQSAIELEVNRFCQYIHTADPQEGLRAFLEKRLPNFQAGVNKQESADIID